MASHGLESPRAGCGVVWGERLMAELRALAIEAFGAPLRRGTEIGGILLGDFRGGSVRIRGFEEVPAEHRNGPSYSLGEKDWTALSAKLAARPARAPSVIGLFRSFVARDPLVDLADEVFVRRHFPHGDFLFLALQPLSAATCVAGFRFFQNGALLPRSGDPPFVLEPAPAGPEEEEKMLWPPLRPPQPPPPMAAPRPLPPKPAPKRREKRAQWWIPLAVAAVLAVNAAAFIALWKRAETPHWAELHLDALPHAGALAISWDASAARSLRATAGLLTVTDAGRRHEIALTADEVHAGTYVYKPASGDDDVRLVLYTHGKGVAGDSVRLASSSNLAPGLPAAGEPERTAPLETPLLASPASMAAPSAEPPPRATPSPAATPAVRPWPVHETEPRIPDGIRSRLRKPVTVSVAMDVSAQGRVVHARSELAHGDDVQRYLAMVSEKAAFGWRFRPARAPGGDKVPASTTVYFVFYPSSRAASAKTGY